MKKLILTVALGMMSIQAFPQSGGLGGAPSTIDPSTNSRNESFGGGLGGASSPNTEFGGALGGAPSTTTPSDSTSNTSGNMGTIDQQRMEDDTNFAGGSLGGGNNKAPLPQTMPDTSPTSRTPSGTGTTTPDSGTRNVVPGPSGVGTGYPSGF
jgi:hypothetical protein